MADMFQRYEASSESIREIARKSNTSATSVGDVRRRVEDGHRGAINEASGDLATAFMGPPSYPFQANAREIARGAIWAACQLERFADAIDIYNETSEEPRSIRKLNTAYAQLDEDSDPLRRGARQLIAEKGRLEARLDTAADEVARNLDRTPSDSEVRRAWKAGNLPAAAMVAWPELHLKLTDLPFDLTNSAITAEGLDALTDQQLVDSLMDPDLNADLREMILESRPDAVALLGHQWQLTRETEGRADYLCRPNTTGQIVGPDGRLYQVSTPDEAPPRDPDVPELGYVNDFIPDDGSTSQWRTLGSRDGEMALGEPIDLGLTNAYVLAGLGGAGKPIGHWQSIGKDQSQYLDMNDGSAIINDGSGPPSSVDRQPLGPVPDSMLPRDPYNRWDGANNATFLAIMALDGLNNSKQAEYNRHYATEVTFQENAEGYRRAVINLYQVRSDGTEVRVNQSYGMVDPETGEIVPASSG